MYAKGPCQLSTRSHRRLQVQFTACDSCPIGFVKHIGEDTSCTCVCDSKLESYITKCNASTEQLERQGNFWITYVDTGDNTTNGYLIYPHCPFSYCLPSTMKVDINLNVPKGADVQCANGRSGMLCGRCRENLSLSIGSSRCIPCTEHWSSMIVILVVALLSGIMLVIVVLVFNLTVAVGTLNGVIFYSNIIAANRSTFIPLSRPNFASIFIAWLNLEIGFDTCFFVGMDAYSKTLLQLAFPLYIIFLVFAVIFLSERSTKFALLISQKNPVATLATLILLSYVKLLNTVIASLSYTTLVFPDGSHRKVWLPDANVEYLSGKHIGLFIIAILIFLAGIAYTSLLFSWQWLLRYQHMKIFSWTKYQKLCHFFEPYHAPYFFEQCYWTGLLFLVRVIVYVVSASNVGGDPQGSIASTVILVGLLPLLKGLIERKIYRQRWIDVIDMIVYFNIVSFSALTLKSNTRKNQMVVAYVSTAVTFVILVVVVLFHVFRYTCLFATTKWILAKCREYKNRHRNQSLGEQLLSNSEANDHEPTITHSVIEIPIIHHSQSESARETHSDHDKECTIISPTSSATGMVSNVGANMMLPPLESISGSTGNSRFNREEDAGAITKKFH